MSDGLPGFFPRIRNKHRGAELLSIAMKPIFVGKLRGNLSSQPRWRVPTGYDFAGVEDVRPNPYLRARAYSQPHGDRTRDFEVTDQNRKLLHREVSILMHQPDYPSKDGG